MSRNDFAPLSVPDWGETAPVETAQPLNSLQDFLGRKTAYVPVSVPPSPAVGGDDGVGIPRNEPNSVSSRDQAAQPASCPHCSSGLSAAEVKLERCLCCGKCVSAVSQQMLVHI
jgi:hypothetical protein